MCTSQVYNSRFLSNPYAHVPICRIILDSSFLLSYSHSPAVIGNYGTDFNQYRLLFLYLTLFKIVSYSIYSFMSVFCHSINLFFKLFSVFFFHSVSKKRSCVYKLIPLFLFVPNWQLDLCSLENVKAGRYDARFCQNVKPSKWWKHLVKNGESK